MVPEASERAAQAEQGRRPVELVEDWPGPALLVDAQGTIRRANAAAEALDAGVLEPVLAAACRAIRAGVVGSLEAGRRDEHGTTCWYRVAVAPRADDHAQVLLTDVSDLVREQERLRRSAALLVDLQGAAHLGTWEWDVRDARVTWSPGLYRIYGLDEATHTPTYDDYLARVHPDDRERVRQATEGALHHHVPYGHDERVLRSDGAWRYLHTWAHPVVDAEGRLVRLVGACQDVTERRVAELQLAATEARLRVLLERLPLERGAGPASVRTAEHVLRIVSHELRNPLGPMTVQAQLLHDGRLGPLEPRQQRAVSVLLTQCRRLGELVADLLDAARVQAGALGGQAEDVVLDDLVGEVVESLGAAAADWGVGLRVAVTPLPSLRGHPVRLRQVLYNLLGNALKYAPAGTEVVVATAREGDEAVVHVTDRGPGLTLEQLDRLFVPFARVHVDDPGRQRGTGLGLYVARAIVEAHGGTIGATSDGPGHGSTFWFRLPLR